jgi:hypothetical protein
MSEIYGRLKPTLKKRLLAALTGGEYRKGTGRLVKFAGGASKDDRFCCLGVLANIQDGVTFNDDFEGRVCYRGEPLRNGIYFLDDKLAGGMTMEAQRKLASLNDANRTWAKVVKFIEEKL